MKRIKRRASAALLLAWFMIAGTAVLMLRLVRHGDEWASYRSSISVYTKSGVLSKGTITDRNGVILASAEGGNLRYADDYSVRLASLHTVGDYSGHIGTAALSAFANELTGYTAFSGTAGHGGTVALTLDARLQAAAWEALQGRTGAVLVMNYQTGEILCMVSSPSYDPYGEPDESIDGLYVNRAISAAYTPGSVFKIVTLTAAVEELEDAETRTFRCSGTMNVPGGTVTCMKSGGHGKQKITQAFAHSCNCAFAEMSLDLGGDVLADFAAQLGMTEAHSLNGIPVSAGRFDGVNDGSSYQAWSGVGQHTDLVCPYSMMRLCAAIAAGGKIPEPTLLLGKGNGTARVMKESTAERVKEIMLYAGKNQYGNPFPGLSAGGKTGTAEMDGATANAWFTGFIDDEKLPLAFTVVLEHGGGGSGQALPICKTMISLAKELYYDD